MEPFNTQQNTQQGDAQTASQGTEKVHEIMHGLEGWLAPLYENAPHIPEKGRKVITDIAPWITLVFGILGAFGIVTGGLAIVVATVFTGGLALMFILGNLLPMLCAAVSVVLMLLSFPGLKAMQKMGWNYAFYSEVVSIVGGVLGLLSGNIGSLFGAAISAIIGFWLLFEVRSYYR
jgi:hypothetical protein